jgi:hypothetical protein
MPSLQDLQREAILSGIHGAQMGQGSDVVADRMKQDRDSQIKQLLLGKQIEQAKSLHEANPEANVNVEGVSIGGRDPLRDLLRRRELSQPMLTPGQEAADKAFGKDYADYVAGGGRQGVEKNLAQLEHAKQGLQHPGMLDRAASYIPIQKIREVITPDAVAREESVKNAIQSTLRQTLGSQFTEKEGQALMDRAYNPRLAPEENMRRLDLIIGELKGRAAQKERSAQLFEKTGSLKGLSGAEAPKSQSNPQLDAIQRRIQELEAKRGR